MSCRLSVCGFNGFGQFSSLLAENHKENGKISTFTDIDFGECFKGQLEKVSETDSNGDEIDYKLEDIDIDQIMFISCGWSFVVFAFPRFLIFKGFCDGKANNLVVYPLKRILESMECIKSISSSDNETLLLTNHGVVWKFNSNSPNTPKKIEYYENSGNLAKIEFIACGNNINAAISEENSIFQYDDEMTPSSASPTSPPPPPQSSLPNTIKMKQLECGHEHVVALADNGDVFTWGNGLFFLNSVYRRGQLGCEMVMKQTNPCLVKALAGIKIASIGAGGWHTVALSIYYDIYTWGFNTDGQLGIQMCSLNNSNNNHHHQHLLKEKSMMMMVYWLPHLIDLPTKCCTRKERTSTSKLEELRETTCAPVKVAAGTRHTAIMTSCGAIYISGCNKYGQLGIPIETETEAIGGFKLAKILENKDNNLQNEHLMAQCWNTLLLSNKYDDNTLNLKR